MSDLTRYRINTNKLSFGEGEVIAALKHSTILVPDDTLQQIADAYKDFIEVSDQGRTDSLESRAAFAKTLSLLDGLVRVNGEDK